MSVIEIGKYFKSLREERGYSTREASEKLEVSQSMLSLVENGKRKPSLSLISKIAKLYNLTEEKYRELAKQMGYVVFDSEKVLSGLLKITEFERNKKAPTIYMVKVYERISAGLPNWGDNQCIGVLPVDPVIMNISDIENCFFVKVSGESMNKVIANGSYALIRKTEYVENNDIAVVLVNGEATIKKFIKKENVILLEPMSTDNSFSTQIYTEKDDVKVIGKYLGKFELN